MGDFVHGFIAWGWGQPLLVVAIVTAILCAARWVVHTWSDTPPFGWRTVLAVDSGLALAMVLKPDLIIDDGKLKFLAAYLLIACLCLLVGLENARRARRLRGRARASLSGL